jgi:zinc transport system substrate-binding protein
MRINNIYMFCSLLSFSRDSMKAEIKITAVIVGVLLLAGALGYAVWTNSEPTEKGKLSVVVTLLPYKFFVERVGGDRISDITDIVPIQAGCGHEYEMTPNQMKAVSNAQIYIAVGAGHEFEEANLEKIQEQNPDMTIIDTSKGISLLTNTEGDDIGATNPHVWTSPRNAIIIVRNICDGLIRVDPTGTSFYETNRDAFITELSQLDNDTQRVLQSYANWTFCIYHPAWPYFARDYHLHQLPIEEVEEQAPSPQRIQNVIDQAKALNLTVVYRSPVDDPSSSETIAEALGGHVVVINHMAEDYIDNIRNVTAELLRGFQG